MLFPPSLLILSCISPILTQLVHSEKWSPLLHHHHHSLEDLTAQESRYKVVAKPVPYKPPQPAPESLDEFESINFSTTINPEPKRVSKFESFKPKKYDNADIIYPTTTYRPQKFQLSELLANHSPGPSVNKYLPTVTTTTTTKPAITITAKPTTSRKPRKKEIINEIPFGTKRKVNKNRRRKVVKRVKKKNSKRWKLKNKRKNKSVTTTQKPEQKQFWNSGRDRIKTKSQDKQNKHLLKQQLQVQEERRRQQRLEGQRQQEQRIEEQRQQEERQQRRLIEDRQQQELQQRRLIEDRQQKEREEKRLREERQQKRLREERQQKEREEKILREERQQKRLIEDRQQKERQQQRLSEERQQKRRDQERREKEQREKERRERERQQRLQTETEKRLQKDNRQEIRQEEGFFPFTPLPPLNRRPSSELFEHRGDAKIQSVKNPRKAKPQFQTINFSTPAPRFPPIPTSPPVTPTPRFAPTTLAPARPTFLQVTPAVPSLPVTPLRPRVPTPAQPVLRSRPTPPPVRPTPRPTPLPLRATPRPPPLPVRATPRPPPAPPRPSPFARRPKVAPLPPVAQSLPVVAPTILPRATPLPFVVSPLPPLASPFSPPVAPPLPPAPPAHHLPNSKPEFFDEYYDYADNEVDYDFVQKPYSFTYGVKDEYSGTDFQRNEESHGDTIRGSYKVALPDGRVQIVSYEADDDGYRATVSYEGTPVHPAPGQYNTDPGVILGGAPPADVFHALPLVRADKSHSSFDLKPHLKAVTPPSLLTYDDYEYYDEPTPALLPTKIAPTPTHYASLSPKPHLSYTPKPTPHPYTPTPAPYSPTPTPYVSTYAPPVSPHFSTYAPPTPHPYTPKPSYAPYSPQPAYHSTPAPPPAYASPSYAPTPVTPSPYVPTATVKSLQLRPKRYGLKIPNYSTLGPHHQFYAPTTYAPPVVSPYSTFKEVFKRKIEQSDLDLGTDYDYEYYEDDNSEYVFSPNRRNFETKENSEKQKFNRNSENSRRRQHHHQLVIADHLHHEKK